METYTRQSNEGPFEGGLLPQVLSVWRKGLPLLIVVIVAITLVLPALVYGGFMMSVATVTFSETTGSLSTATPQPSVCSITVYNYMAMKTGGTL